MACNNYDRIMKYHIILFVSLLLLPVFSAKSAENEVNFTADAPSTVVAGEQFRVTYSLNKEGKNFLAPEMSGFNVLFGPSTSRSSSVQIVNGSVTKNTTISYSYVLVGVDPGKYTLGPAEITVKGNKYSSNPLTIEVLPPDSNAGASSGGQTIHGGGQGIPVEEGGNGAEARIPDDEQIFVRAILSKTKVYEQEALLVTYKIYTRYDLAGFGTVNFPEFKGFYVQDVELDPNRQLQLEHYDGRNYNTFVLKQSLLFPQRSGDLSIEPGEVDVTLRVRNNRQVNNFFDDFFSTYSNVNKTLRIPGAEVEVMPLPAGAPSSFKGAVGTFTMQSDISATELKANDAVTVKINLSGTGNLRLLKNPEIKFPLDFDVYDPKVETSVKTSLNGLQGSRKIEYLAIPRFGGEFEIPSAEFSYFDTTAKTYKTLKTPAYTLKVEEGKGGTQDTQSPSVQNYKVNKEDVKNIGTDIRYIHSNNGLDKTGEYFYGSPVFVSCFVIPLALFLLILVILRRRAKENADLARMKTKRANKQAKKRLKSAAKFKKAGDASKFYEETMKALWGYLGDKLSIPASSLTKENVQEKLIEHKATAELAREFLDTLSDCEFARFSPAAGESLSMDKIYEKAVNLIGKLEDTLK